MHNYLNRRVEKAVYEGEVLMSKKRFIYHGYLQIAELDASGATETAAPILRKTYLWDPLEPVATRVLAMSIFDETGSHVEDLYYTHDLLKNTTALFGIQAGRRDLYEYGPYGNILKIEGNAAQDNLFRFSSEYVDNELGLVYHNYRYYNSKDGRWLSRDPMMERGQENLYGYVENYVGYAIDILGLAPALKRQKSAFSVVAGHLQDIDRVVKNFKNRLPSVGTPCDKIYPMSCGRSADGGLLWPSEEAKKRHEVYRPKKDPTAPVYVSSPSNPVLADELIKKIQEAEQDAEKECDKKKTCCSTIKISVQCRPSDEMKTARHQDKRVITACAYSNTYTCKRGKKEAKWSSDKIKDKIGNDK